MGVTRLCPDRRTIFYSRNGDGLQYFTIKAATSSQPAASRRRPTLSPLSPPKSAAQGKPNASITEGGYAERIAFFVYTPTLSPLSPPKSTAAAAAGAATAAAAVRAGREGDGEVAGGGGGPRLPLRRQRRAPRRPPRRPGGRPRRLGGGDSDGVTRMGDSDG